MKRTTFYVVSVTLVAAIGGLIFGFDTAIVAGATRYMKEQFSLDSLQEGWAVAVVLIGCMFGAGLAGPISDRIGRRRFMRISAVLFLVSAAGCALPRTITEFVVFRFVGGLGIGSAAVLSPLYIAEIAPARIRGALVSVNQLAIVTGILLAYFVNWAVRRGRAVELALDVRHGRRALGRLLPAAPARPREPALAGQERPRGRRPGPSSPGPTPPKPRRARSARSRTR